MHSNNTAVKRYRLYVWLGHDRYYANRSTLPLPHVGWFTKSAAYPDHYTEAEMKEIKAQYSEQAIRVEEIYVLLED